MRRLVMAELRTRRRTTLGLAAGAFAFLFALAASYQAFGGRNMTTKLFSGTPPSAVAAFSGSRSTDLFSPHHYLGFGFNHPLFLVLTLSVAIAFGSRSVAGDVETGRAELLYTRPVARRRLLIAHVVAWLPVQAAVVIAAALGAVTGSLLSSDLVGIPFGGIASVALQYGAVTWFVAGVAFLASACSRSQGTALGATVGVTALAYLVNFVSLLWQPIGAARWLSPFGYYEPLTVIDSGVDLGRLGVLLVGGAALLAAALAVLDRRDLV